MSTPGSAQLQDELRSKCVAKLKAGFGLTQNVAYNVLSALCWPPGWIDLRDGTSDATVKAVDAYFVNIAPFFELAPASHTILAAAAGDLALAALRLNRIPDLVQLVCAAAESIDAAYSADTDFLLVDLHARATAWILGGEAAHPVIVRAVRKYEQHAHTARLRLEFDDKSVRDKQWRRRLALMDAYAAKFLLWKAENGAAEVSTQVLWATWEKATQSARSFAESYKNHGFFEDALKAAEFKLSDVQTCALLSGALPPLKPKELRRISALKDAHLTTYDGALYGTAVLIAISSYVQLTRRQTGPLEQILVDACILTREIAKAAVWIPETTAAVSWFLENATPLQAVLV